jgi:hypothetical protein
MYEIIEFLQLTTIAIAETCDAVAQAAVRHSLKTPKCKKKIDG